MANESISIPDFLINKLKTGKSKSLRGAAIQTLERYFEILAVGNREVRKTFSDNELLLLADICNGTLFEPFGMILENNDE